VYYDQNVNFNCFIKLILDKFLIPFDLDRVSVKSGLTRLYCIRGGRRKRQIEIFVFKNDLHTHVEKFYVSNTVRLVIINR